MNPIEATGTSIEALTKQYHAIAQNLANVATTGFKRTDAVFQAVLASQMSGAGEAAPAVSASEAIDFTQGPLVHTGWSLDLALHGDGFFVIEDPQVPGGLLYTRSGSFRLNAQRQVVDGAGRLVQGEGGQIVVPPEVPPERVAVAETGEISANGQEIGKLRIVSFEEPHRLQQVGASVFRGPDDAIPEPATARVLQGFQEGSNVSAVRELVNLIMVTRLYEANLKTVSVRDERMKNILQVVMS